MHCLKRQKVIYDLIKPLQVLCFIIWAENYPQRKKYNKPIIEQSENNVILLQFGPLNNFDRRVLLFWITLIEDN